MKDRDQKMAEVKLYTPFAENDNYSASTAEPENVNSLFISTRMLRGEHVTQENSGLSPEEWDSVVNRFECK